MWEMRQASFLPREAETIHIKSSIQRSVFRHLVFRAPPSLSLVILLSCIVTKIISISTAFDVSLTATWACLAYYIISWFPVPSSLPLSGSCMTRVTWCWRSWCFISKKQEAWGAVTQFCCIRPLHFRRFYLESIIELHHRCDNRWKLVNVNVPIQ